MLFLSRFYHYFFFSKYFRKIGVTFSSFLRIKTEGVMKMEIHIENIRKKYKNITALKDMNIKLKTPAMVGLVGPK